MSQPDPGGSGSGGGRPPARRRLQDRIRDRLHQARDGWRRLRNQAQDGVRNLLAPRNRGPEPGLTLTQREDIAQMDAYLNPPTPPTPTPEYGALSTAPPSFHTNPSSRSDPPSFRTNASYRRDEIGDTGSPTQPGPGTSGRRRRPPLLRQSAFLTVPIPPSAPRRGPESGNASRGGGHHRPTFTLGSETDSDVSSNTSQTGSNVSQTGDGAQDPRILDRQAEREEHWRNTRQGREEPGRDGRRG